MNTFAGLNSEQAKYTKGHIRFLLFMLLLVIVGTFAGIFFNKTDDVVKIALPIITAIAGAVGGYGVGLNKGRKEQEPEE